MPDELHPEWWYTAWYAETEEASGDGLRCRIFAAQEAVWPSEKDLLVGEVAYEVADLIVEWWNDSHSAPGAPLVQDAGETAAFLDEKPGALAVVEAARDNERLLHTLLREAWDELEAAEAHHRWHHEQEGREVEPREERLALLMAMSEALDDEAAPEPFASASDVLAATLRFVASLHHRTLTNSKLHDPERLTEFADCPCLPCRKAAAALRLAERAVFDAGPAAAEEAKPK